MTSLIPERPLLISPTLAATIGLEEAVLLHVLSELIPRHAPIFRQQRRWGEITTAALIEALPFWELNGIRRVQRSLQDLGLLLVDSVAGNNHAHLYAINQPDAGSSPAQATVPTSAPRATPFQSSAGTATYIPHNWQPDATLFQQCLQRNIPRDFVEQAVPGFVMYWRERQKTQYSWHHIFLNWVVADWEKQRSAQGAKEQESPMTAAWQPSLEALEILEISGINRSFIEDAIPEFVLYWRERGVAASTWSTRFIAHVRRQWDRYTYALENDTTPRPIPPDFVPSPEFFDILAMANIDAEFARAQVREFVLYWRDRNEIHASWNTKFLQHVKYQWAQQMQPQSQPLLDKLRDRSWAE